MIVSPYDAELYGHWWFEGLQFLDDLFRQIHFNQNEIEPSRPANTWTATRPNQLSVPCAPRGGIRLQRVLAERVELLDFRICTSPAERWSSCRIDFLARRRCRSRVKQAARERMLAESTDWAFIMRTGTTVRTRRAAHAHILQFTRLYEDLIRGEVSERWLSTSRQRTNLPGYGLSPLRLVEPSKVHAPAAQGCSSWARSAHHFPRSAAWAMSIGALPKALSGAGIDVRDGHAPLRGIAWQDLERLEGSLRADRYGRSPRSVRHGHLPKSECRSYFLEHHTTSIAPTSTVRRPELPGQPRAVHGFLARRNRADEGAPLYPGRRFTERLADGARPVYLNTVEWAQADARRRERYTIHNLAPQGVFDAGALFITGLGRGTTIARIRALRTVNLTKGAPTTARFSVRSAPRTRARSDARVRLRTRRRARQKSGRSGRRSQRHHTEVWSPNRILTLLHASTARHLAGKRKCKRALRSRRVFRSPEVPLIRLVGRLTPQKGVRRVRANSTRFARISIYKSCSGTGDPDAERFLAHVVAPPGPLPRVLGFEQPEGPPHRAGADFFLIPRGSSLAA